MAEAMTQDSGLAGHAKKGKAFQSLALRRRRTEPGVVPSLLTDKPDPRGLSMTSEVSYAQRYAIGVPRLLARNPGAKGLPAQGTTQEELPKGIVAVPAKKPQRKFLRTQSVRATAEVGGTRASDDGSLQKPRWLLRTATNGESRPPAAFSVKRITNQKQSTHVGTEHVYNNGVQVMKALTELPDESVVANTDAPIKAYRAQVPKEGRPKRLTNSASQKKSTQSVAVEQPGKDDRPAVDASPPTKSLPASAGMNGGGQETLLPSQPEGLALTAGSHSTPESPVLAFESRTERLLNQHKRIEEQHNMTSAVALPSQGSGRIGSSTLKRRQPSSPSLNPIPSLKVVVFSAADSKVQAKPPATLKQQAMHSRNTKHQGIMAKVLGCFFCGSTAAQDEAETAQIANGLPPIISRRTSANEAEPPLTSADLLRKSITLLSTTSTPRASIAVSEQLLDAPQRTQPAPPAATADKLSAEAHPSADPLKKAAPASEGASKAQGDAEAARGFLHPKAKPDSLKCEAAVRKREANKRYGGIHRMASSNRSHAALQRAVSTNFCRHSIPATHALRQEESGKPAWKFGGAGLDKLQAQKAGASERVGHMPSSRRTSDGGRSCCSSSSKAHPVRHSHDGALRHSAVQKVVVLASNPAEPNAAAITSSKADEQSAAVETRSKLASAAFRDQQALPSLDEEVPMRDYQGGRELPRLPSASELLMLELQAITERAKACSEAAAAALKAHEEESLAFSAARQGSRKLSAPSQLPRVALQPQPWKLSTRASSLPSSPQKPPKNADRPLPNRKPLYVAPASLRIDQDLLEYPIKAVNKPKLSLAHTKSSQGKKLAAAVSAFSVSDILSQHNHVEKAEDITEEASSTLELLFGYQQPKESTFVVDGLDYCSSGDDTYSAFADACTEDIALSAEREAGAEGGDPDHQASSGFGWAGFSGRRGDAELVEAEPAKSAVEGSTSLLGLSTGILSAAQQSDKAESAVDSQQGATQAMDGLEAKASSNTPSSTLITSQREIHVDVQVAFQDPAASLADHQTFKQPLPADPFCKTAEQAQVGSTAVEDALGGKQDQERKQGFWWLPGISAESRKKSGSWMPASAIVRSLTAAFDSSTTNSDKPARHSATGRLVRV